MTSPSLAPEHDASSSLREKVATFSDHLRSERRARSVLRAHHRAEQSNSANSPQDRIYAWERLHGLQLPSEPSHPVLLAVANGTGLSVSQIREEQATRAALDRPVASKLAVDLSVYGVTG